MSAAIGASAVAVWSERLGALSARQAATRLADAGLTIAAVNRGGFFASDVSPGLAESRERTLREIAFCAEIGADTLIIVPGGLPDGSHDLRGARARFEDGFSSVLPQARQAGVKLAIEPFHPALAALRGVVNRLRDAVAICRRAGSGSAVIVDIYHVWWDPDLMTDIAAAGDLIAGYHLCDYQLAPRDMVFDRALVGKGVADAVAITGAVLATGYGGPLEVEVFSKFDLWRRDPAEAAEIYRTSLADHLGAVEASLAGQTNPSI